MSDYVSFSGGKDSTALALVMKDAIPIFADTGDEFDEIYAHIDKFERVTGRQVIRIQNKETLPEYVKRSKFLPGHGARFCTRMFKIEPINRYLKDNLPATLMIGLRADEPEELRVGNLTEMDGLNISYPLRELGININDVLKVCLDNDLLPRYPAYMARGGCKGCFYKRAAEVRALQHLAPDVLDELQEREESVQDERGKFAVMFPNTGMSIADIKRQPALFDMTELYAQAAQDEDKGAACGAFCHR